MPRHFRLPIRESHPSTVSPHRILRHQKSVGIGNGAATHGRSMQDQNVTENLNIEEAAKSDAAARSISRWPSLFLGNPWAPTASHLQNANAVTFAGQTMRTYAAAKPRPNDNEVEVIMSVWHCRVHYAPEIRYGQRSLPLRCGSYSHSVVSNKNRCPARDRSRFPPPAETNTS